MDRLLERAKRGASFDPTIRYHLGAAYLEASEQEKGRTELEEALAISRTFPEADDVARLLRELWNAHSEKPDTGQPFINPPGPRLPSPRHCTTRHYDNGSGSQPPHAF